jgi:hypothetical protein
MAQGKLVYQGSVRDLLATSSPAYKLLVRPPAERLKALLSTAEWSRSVREERPGEFIIDVNDAVATEEQIARLIADSGARLIEYSRSGPSLEDKFFDLTDTGPYRQRRHQQAVPQ